MLCKLALDDEWGEIGKMLSPELYELVTNWDNLSWGERREISGHALGKLGGMQHVFFGRSHHNSAQQKK